MIKCDDCGKEIIGTHIYWKGRNRCWKCDEKFLLKTRNNQNGIRKL